MKKHRILSIILALILTFGVFPMTAMAEGDELHGVYLSTRDNPIDGSYYIVGLSFSWLEKAEDMLLSDITDLVVTRDGVPIEVSIRSVDTYTWSSSQGESGVGYDYIFEEPLYNAGEYDASFVYKGQSLSVDYAFALTGEAHANNAPSDAYLIGSEEELRAFADMINRGDEFTNHYVMLTQDITLTGEWTPIGRSEGSGETYVGYGFYGTFDGDGHTISGVKIGSADNPCTLEQVGFFGSSVNVRNLSLDVEIYARSPEQWYQEVGGIAAGGTMVNCTVTGSIHAEDSSSVGGIAGSGQVIADSHSFVDITVSGYSDVGGIVGSIRNGNLEELDGEMYILPRQTALQNCSFDGTISGSGSLGGIAGSVGSGTEITGCSSSGDIDGSASDEMYGGTTAGGLIGNCGEAVIRDCYATGSVTGETAGGLIGYLHLGYRSSFEYRLMDSYEGNIIENCYASGGVTGTGYAGGLIGEIDWADDDVLNIRSCHASGAVHCSGDWNVAGGFAGETNIFNGSIENCYATGDVSGEKAGGFTGELTSYQLYYTDSQIGGGEQKSGTLGVSRCFASGNVTALSYAGGFTASNVVDITDCAALGDVSSGGYAYGFAYASTYYGVVEGAEYHFIERCYASGDVSVTGENAVTAYAFGGGELFLNCHAAGSASGDGAAMAFEGCASSYFTGTLTGAKGNAVCYYVLNSYGDETVFPEGYELDEDYDFGKTTSEMQSQEFVDLLNSEQPDLPWSYKAGSYPILAKVQFNSISVEEAENGKITASTDRGVEGNVIVIYAQPDSGYELKSLRYNGEAIDGRSFTMPEGNVTVTAEFAPVSSEGSGSAANGADGTPTGADASGSTANTWIIVLIAIAVLILIGGAIWAALRKKKQGVEAGE